MADQKTTVLETTLDNGTQLIVLCTPGLHSAVIDAHVRVGSRFEQPTNSGISHFLEHMLCRGTKRHPSAHEQALAFERLAGSLTAATMIDHGSLTVIIPPANFESVLGLFWEAFSQPLLDAIEVERGIVEQEMLECLDEQGRQIDGDNLVRQLCFGDHPLGFPITGPVEHLQSFDSALIRAHHAAHYTGACTVVTAAGPLDPERTLAELASYFERLPRGSQPVSTSPPAQSEARWQFVQNPASQTALRVAFRAPGAHDPLEPATELLLRVLDDGMSTRLYHQICDLRGLCYDVSAGYEPYADVGLFDLQAETAHERAPEVLDEMLRVVRELRDTGLEPTELEKAKTRVAWELSALLDDCSELAEFYADGALRGGARTPESRRAELEAVTREQVQAAAQRIFRAENLSAVGVGMQRRRGREALAQRIRQF